MKISAVFTLMVIAVTAIDAASFRQLQDGAGRMAMKNPSVPVSLVITNLMVKLHPDSVRMEAHHSTHMEGQKAAQVKEEKTDKDEYYKDSEEEKPTVGQYPPPQAKHSP